MSLTPALRALIGRLAVERLRPTIWAATHDLRQQVQQRLAAGEDPQALAEDLRQAIVTAQERMSSARVVQARRAREGA